jgi:drug/metabolite transporter (DMT)-like permease
VLFWSFAVATVFWCVTLPPARVLATASQPGVAAGFLVLGVFSTLVPFALFYSGLRRLPSSEAGVIATSEPVIGIVTAAVALGESLAPMQLLGAALVVVAAMLASRAHPETAEAGVERG